MKKTTTCKLLILLLTLITIFSMSACRRKESPNHGNTASELSSSNLSQNESVEAVGINPEFTEGYIGTMEFEGMDFPVILSNGLCYCLIGDSAFVVYTMFTDETLLDYKINEYVEYEEVQYHVVKIDEEAFRDFTELVSITIPKSVKRIGANAFDGCDKLKEVIIPEGVEYIEDSAFSECTSLISVTLPSTVKEMGNSIFFGCTSLESVVLSEGISMIPDDTFSNCENLKNISLPSSLKTIASEVFWACSSLKSINLPEGLVSIGDRCFYDCGALAEVVIPASLTSIGDSLFDYCESLTELNVPAAKMSNFEILFKDYDLSIKGY